MEQTAIHNLVAASVLLGMTLCGSAEALTLSFAAYNADVPDLDISVDITVDNGMALFDFANNSGGAAAGSSLARIYFESGLETVGLSNGNVMGGTGTNFGSSYPGPASPPGGVNVGWAGELAAFGALPPPPRSGLGAGETLLIAFDYSGTLPDLVSAISDSSGNARIAGHILDCNDGESCAATAVVPIPAGLPLLLSALAGLGLLGRHSRQDRHTQH